MKDPQPAAALPADAFESEEAGNAPLGSQEDEAPKIHMLVEGKGSAMSVSFRTDGQKELAKLSGPGTEDVLAWILAAITDPFTSVTRKDR